MGSVTLMVIVLFSLITNLVSQLLLLIFHTQHVQYLQISIAFLGCVIFVCVVVPWASIALLPYLICVVGLRWYGLKACRQFKRLETAGKLFMLLSDYNHYCNMYFIVLNRDIGL